MANTLNGINLAQISEMSLEALLPVVPFLNAFVTDFSTDIAGKGESVTTRFPTAVTAGDASAGYTATAVQSTARTITLSNHIHFTAGFTDAEVAKATLATLQNLFIGPMVNAVSLSMATTLLNLVTNANFSQNIIRSAANFDADAVAYLQQLLDTAKVPVANRSLLLLPTYRQSLVSDDAIQNAMASGSDQAIREGQTGRVHGFNVIPYTDIPGNSENLAGIACAKQGLCLAARVPPDPKDWAGQAITKVEPNSGLPIQFRTWYEGKDGQQYVTATLMFGVQIGVVGNLYRVLSA